MPRATKKSKGADSPSKLKSRKLMIGFVVLAAGVAIDLTVDRGLSDNLLTLLIAILGIYVTGNVGSKFVGEIQSNKRDVPVSNPALEGEVKKLAESQAQYEQYLSGTLNTVELMQQQVAGLEKLVQQGRPE